MLNTVYENELYVWKVLSTRNMYYFWLRASIVDKQCRKQTRHIFKG